MQVYGAGGKTTPKKGRLGTGSYYPEGTPLYLHRGNVFPGIHAVRPDFTQIRFGSNSRAGIATVVGQDRTASRSINPNSSQYDYSTLPLAPAMVVPSISDANNFQPISPAITTLQMPHERNTNSASGEKKKPNPYRPAAGGASSSMISDTPFHPAPNANYQRFQKPKAGVAKEAVKVNAPTRTIAAVSVRAPKSGGLHTGQMRTPPASFISRNNIWSDPNNSFLDGQTSASTGQVGTGRWSMVKQGVV